MLLNDSQQSAVTASVGPVLVIAGAGTGKTRVIVERINRLLTEGTPSKRLLALTFTEKAAAEMQDRVNEAHGNYLTDMPIMTFNAYGESLLRRYAADIGLGRNFQLMGDNAQIVFMRERLDALGLDYFAPLSRPDGQLSNLSDYFSKLKQNVVTPDDYDTYVKTMPAGDAAEQLEKTKHQELASGFRSYVELCKQAGVIDYDDQIYLLIELFRIRPNVLKEVQSNYDYVMVDEFQDTNVMQSELVDMLAGSKQNLFVVGDDDQSIYGWRGATLANILSFKDRYPKTREITLLENYRSTKQILDAAYQLIQHNNPHRLEERLKINKQLVAQRSGETPQVHCFETLDEELQWISEDIQQRLDHGAVLSDIAILARRNATIQNIHGQLSFADIPHIVIGQRFELYHEPVVRQLLEVIKAVADPLDNTSLYHALTGPMLSCSPHTVSQLSHTAKSRHESLLEICQADEDKTIQSAISQLQAWRELSVSTTVGQLAYQIFTESGFKDRLYETAVKQDGSAATSLSRLSELFRAMKQFEQVAVQPSALQYIDALPALQAAGDSNEDGTLDLSGDQVSVLSIHKSKGLEWPVVYIVDCSEGSFPLRENSSGIAVPSPLLANVHSEADEHIYEERRLMYVAMTRARNELIMTCASRHGSGRVRKPSRFLSEAFASSDFKSTQPANKPEVIGTASMMAHDTQALVIPESVLNGQQVRLSMSQAIKYQDCPLDFYYRYILNVPQETSSSQAYGTLLHSLLEELNRSQLAGKLLTLEELEERLRMQLPQTGYLNATQRERTLKQGLKTLREVYARYIENPRSAVAIEEPFRVTLSEYNLILTGRFDAVFPYDDNVEIVDYKTSTSIDTPERAKQRASASEQLTLYALAWQQLHGDLPALVTLDFIDTGVTGSLKKTQRGIDGAMQRLQTVADGIRSHDFRAGKTHDFCIHPAI